MSMVPLVLLIFKSIEECKAFVSSRFLLNCEASHLLSAEMCNFLCAGLVLDSRLPCKSQMLHGPPGTSSFGILSPSRTHKRGCVFPRPTPPKKHPSNPGAGVLSALFLRLLGASSPTKLASASSGFNSTVMKLIQTVKRRMGGSLTFLCLCEAWREVKETRPQTCSLNHKCMRVYMCKHIKCVCTYLHIYIYVERERWI